MRWNNLQFNDDGVIEKFSENIVEPLWEFCSKSLDAKTIIGGTLDPFHRVSEKIARAYNERLFKHFKNNKVTRKLRDIKTRLTAFFDEDKGKLINWGYALADAAVRKHQKDILVKIRRPGWPFPKYSL